MGRVASGWHLDESEEVIMANEIRVLVVDDSTMFREALANFVSHLEGVVVVGRARDGQEAVELAARTRAQVVFMDLMMPRLDGLAATRALKQMEEAPAVIICTTDDDDRLRELVQSAGADVFMHKRDLAIAAEPLVRDLAGLQGGRSQEGGGR
jgi:DNA-binding NarL/FixJ family response regulator